MPTRDTSDTAHAKHMEVRLLVGDECRAWARSAENRSQWAALYETCPWGTAFQTPSFFNVWFDHYGGQWIPVLAVAQSEGRLIGLMPLASRSGVITGVGAHQAEYHGWIGDEAAGPAFAGQALDLLRGAFPTSRIHWRYVSPQVPAAVLEALAARDPRVLVRRHECPYLSLDEQAIDDALKKKGNKSKLNRLKRLGDFGFKRLSSADWQTHAGAISAQCDFRQGAVNDSCPFTDDPRKAPFHLAWFEAAPEQCHVSALFLGDALIASVFLIKSKRTAHIGIVTYAPEVAAHSPSKLLLYMAARALAAEGCNQLDMTPGGDAWKERFGTHHETAFELIAYPTRAEAMRIKLQAGMRRGLSAVANALSISPERREAIKNVLRRSTSSSTQERRPTGHTHILRVDLGNVKPRPQEVSIIANPLAELVAWATRQGQGRRHEHLRRTLSRIEAGETCFAYPNGDGTLHAAWVETTGDGSVATLRGWTNEELDVASTAGRNLAEGIIQRLQSEGRVGSITLAVAENDEHALTFLKGLGFSLEQQVQRPGRATSSEGAG